MDCGTALNPEALGGLCPRCVALDFLSPTPSCGSEAGTPILEADERRMGDYELLEEIARGGMGVVYLARQISLGRNVAVKMILNGVLAGDTAIARFKAEAAAAAGLSHPNIVAIHEIGEHKGRHYFSMEFITGRTLAELVRDGPLPARVAAGYLERVAAAVHFAHERGVLHRDLKPSNILIDGQGQPSNGVHLARDFFVLLDFLSFSCTGLAASFFSSLFI
jgi:serine/threonine protein kinase